MSRLIESRLGDPDKARRLLARTGPRDAPGLVTLSRELFAPDVVEALVGAAARGSERAPDTIDVVPRTPTDYRAMAAAELARYLQPMLLPDADAFSMASSIELRVPFVDREFFAVMLNGDRPVGKRGLVAVLDDPYLRDLARRPKTGFALPMASWMQAGPLREVVAAARRPDAPLWDVVDRTAGLPRLDGQGIAGRWSEPWALAVLDAWLRRR
jgi:asparagine synthase (glutamine-hydrolysing)